MMSKWFGSLRVDRRSRANRGVSSRPELEGLESRLLLYSTLGANWTYGSRITYSFVPDGTDLGGATSNLYSTLDAKFATATWQLQFEKAASAWETYANINLAKVSDNGTSLGGGSYQQGDPNMGDIRISMASLPAGQLAFTILPPPINGDSFAGDIVLNSNINWGINSNYDLMTVAIHEFGHALGMDHSSVTTADMYPIYTGLKQAPTADDIAGIQSIYGAPQPDMFDSGGTNNNYYTTATNITSYINGISQISISDLNISSISDSDWFYVTAPATTTGTMTVTMQSSNLSSLNPRIVVYNSSLGGLAQASAVNSFGGTATVTITGVTPGQSFYFRALPANTPGAIGAYGLLVNFGSYYQAPIAPPNTQVLAQADAGGGSDSEMIGGSHVHGGRPANQPGLGAFHQIQFGQFAGWGDSFDVPTGFLASGGLQNPWVDTSGNSATSDGLAPLLNLIPTSPTSSTQTGRSDTQNEIEPSTVGCNAPGLVLQALDDALTQWNGTSRWSIFSDPQDATPA
jgi:hypothetical protein